ncbi:hypothetical protein [Streptomyces sp. NPDC089915]|uniref:hypothetical protein n=1 Tax=Streptomyces sp. NPDC089915 TaxID=3155186 RepID=UPI003432B18F
MSDPRPRVPMRAPRAAMFAAVCVALAAVGHVHMSGQDIPLGRLLGAFAAVAALAWAAAGRRRGPLGITASLLAVQAALHTAFSQGQAHGSTPMAHHHPTGHTAPPRPSALSEGLAPPSGTAHTGGAQPSGLPDATGAAHAGTTHAGGLADGMGSGTGAVHSGGLADGLASAAGTAHTGAAPAGGLADGLGSTAAAAHGGAAHASGLADGLASGSGTVHSGMAHASGLADGLASASGMAHSGMAHGSGLADGLGSATGMAHSGAAHATGMADGMGSMPGMADGLGSMPGMADGLGSMPGMADGMGGGLVDLLGMAGHGGFGMVAAHLLAGLFCAAWLAWGEAAVFRLAGALGATALLAARPLVRVLTLLRTRIAPVPRPPAHRPGYPRPRRLRGAVHAHTAVRRGPPRRRSTRTTALRPLPARA